MKWIIDHELDRCVISIYAWAMLGFTQPYKASRVKPSLVLEITTTAHIAISLCFNKPDIESDILRRQDNLGLKVTNSPTMVHGQAM